MDDNLAYPVVFLFGHHIAEALFQMLMDNFRENFSPVYDEYEKINNNYHSIQREDVILQI